MSFYRALPLFYVATAANMESELNTSLVKWHTDYVDVLYLHRDDPETSVQEIIDALNKFKKR